MSHARSDLAPRDVYRLPFTKDGRPVYAAVDSVGECLALLSPDGERVSDDMARAVLRELLDRCDAMPRLALVTDEGPVVAAVDPPQQTAHARWMSLHLSLAAESSSQS